MNSKSNTIPAIYYVGVVLSFVIAASAFGILLYDHFQYSDYLENKKKVEFWPEKPAEAKAGVNKAKPKKTENIELPDDLGPLVASKSGKKFHLPDCSSAKRILPKNLIKFKTVSEAKAAGYTPSKSCFKNFKKK